MKRLRSHGTKNRNSTDSINDSVIHGPTRTDTAVNKQTIRSEEPGDSAHVSQQGKQSAPSSLLPRKELPTRKSKPSGQSFPSRPQQQRKEMKADTLGPRTPSKKETETDSGEVR